MIGWLFAGNAPFGIATDPSQMQAMNAAQLAEYHHRQGYTRNAVFANALSAMQCAAAYRPPLPKPTMTLAEYDARRKAFKPRSRPPEQ